jgi:hypothetical protein
MLKLSSGRIYFQDLRKIYITLDENTRIIGENL